MSAMITTQNIRETIQDRSKYTKRCSYTANKDLVQVLSPRTRHQSVYQQSIDNRLSHSHTIHYPR